MFHKYFLHTASPLKILKALRRQKFWQKSVKKLVLTKVQNKPIKIIKVQANKFVLKLRSFIENQSRQIKI